MFASHVRNLPTPRTQRHQDSHHKRIAYSIVVIFLKWPISCIQYDLLQSISSLAVLGHPCLGPLNNCFLHFLGHITRLGMIGHVNIHGNCVTVSYSLSIHLRNQRVHLSATWHYQYAEGYTKRRTSYSESVQLILNPLRFARNRC